jgi:alkanesulfonate monooxygenase SsuD/methylene tetrahydromethanopterin reductase-like flavin-dependent oxidoreductase (luciferase family)
MKFGIFDQNDWTGRLVCDQYNMRFDLASLYEALGFHIYQVSEHHGTPLSTAPSPSVFLAALSQRTKTMRFGPLVYLLPAYEPLRLAEEISMLDHLSGGRFEFGVGKGASPHEMGFFGIAPEDMQPMYVESLTILMAALEKGVVQHKGRYWQYDGVELSVTPIQRPYPPMWVAVGSPESAVWAAQNNANIVVGGPPERARLVFDRYVAERTAMDDLNGGKSLLMGINRHILVADSEEAATVIGRRAWDKFYAGFIKLWKRFGTEPGNRLPADFDAAVQSGFVVVGSAESVRRNLMRQVEVSGATFVGGNFIFGDISFDEGKRSITGFAQHVMPALRAVRQVHAPAA